MPETDKPDPLSVWNAFCAYARLCRRMTAEQVIDLGTLVDEAVHLDVPLDAAMRRRVEEVLGG